LVIATIAVVSVVVLVVRITSGASSDFILGRGSWPEQALAGVVIYWHALVVLGLLTFRSIDRVIDPLELRSAAKSVPRAYAVGELLEAANILRYSDIDEPRCSRASSPIDYLDGDGSGPPTKETYRHLKNAAYVIRVGLSSRARKLSNRSQRREILDAYKTMAAHVEAYGWRIANSRGAKLAQLADELVLQAVALAKFEDASLLEQLPKERHAQRSLRRVQVLAVAALAGAVLFFAHIFGIALPAAVTR